jgi:hypothetical protein
MCSNPCLKHQTHASSAETTPTWLSYVLAFTPIGHVSDANRAVLRYWREKASFASPKQIHIAYILGAAKLEKDFRSANSNLNSPVHGGFTTPKTVKKSPNSRTLYKR